jgi:hypothetical protein
MVETPLPVIEGGTKVAVAPAGRIGASKEPFLPDFRQGESVAMACLAPGAHWIVQGDEHLAPSTVTVKPVGAVVTRHRHHPRRRQVRTRPRGGSVKFKLPEIRSICSPAPPAIHGSFYLNPIRWRS